MMTSSRTARNRDYRVHTSRFEKREGQLAPAGNTSNIGIACYCCEALATTARGKLPDKTRLAWSTELFRQIVDAAFTWRGVSLWRWEARPQRRDYQYPPDWDDICKAVDALNAVVAERDAPCKYSVPSDGFVDEFLVKTVYDSDQAGQDIILPMKCKRALYMFLADPTEKPNNVEDIFVTAVVVGTLLRHYPQVAANRDRLIHDLLDRIVELAHSGLRDGLPLAAISRCYLHWSQFLWVLWRAVQELPERQEQIRTLVGRFAECSISQFLPPLPLGNCVRDDLAYRRLLIRTTEVTVPVHSSAEIVGVCGPQVMYQHRRLGHLYGADAWSWLLDVMANGRTSSDLDETADIVSVRGDWVDSVLRRDTPSRKCHIQSSCRAT